MGYRFDWNPIWHHRDQVLSGLAITIALSIVGLLGALAIGMAVGTAGAARARPLRVFAVLYVEGVRNVPLLLHIYLWFLGFSAIQLPAFLCAALGLSIYSGAYAAELFRTGLTGVPAQQSEAAAALGLRRWTILRKVIYPQAFRAIAPSLASLSSQLVKDSSLASVVAVGELAYEAGAIDADTFRTFEVYATITVLYLLLVTISSHLILRLVPTVGERSHG
ncbi:MAG TPA: amino acid ABC transporter permease [Aliidongia sp.]|uniref:amino acid ABC transporter permease n=1 Tax=Aliidongia sp. TaxID=1914230 RepID=UPI002DDCDD2B|nr:amino acid ABC transporter permease [Aliidongia sp.]HEV2677634.1 amino acid ABC transporter permease [Aliidongia sp.]